MSDPLGAIIDRLAQFAMLRDIPPDQIAWLASHGRLRHLDAGEILYKDGDPIEGLHLVLSGHLAIHLDRGAGRRKALEWRSGEVSGILPFSRLVRTPGEVMALEPTDFVTVDREHFPEMIRKCQELTGVFVHVMVDRARHFTSDDLHDEKLMSLGKLAAGLAHELNNPASAIARSAKGLGERLVGLESTSRALGGTSLTPLQVSAVQAVRDVCLTATLTTVRSPLERADREDAFVAWLEARGADPALAEPLADTAVTLEALDRMAEVLDRAALDTALKWIASGCATRQLAAELERAATRIYDLVAAVKGFTRMDHATVTEAVDIGRGITDTLAVLQSKARSKSAGVSVHVDPGLPKIQGFGGELNQVWLNLIDNALDAVAAGGRVDVTATGEGTKIVVRVVDDGPGIPAEIRTRIFDPFFTTKPVGAGTGLGLDIVRRLVQRHEGGIEVDSKPGRTEFRVTLPATAPSPTAADA